MRHPTRFLTDYVAGELSPARRQAIERHLSRCLRCSDVVEQETSVRERLQNADTPGPPDGLFERILRESARPPTIGGSAPMNSPSRFDVSAFALRHRGAMALSGGAVVVTVATLTAAYALGAEVQQDEVTAGRLTTAAESWETVTSDTPAQLTAGQIEQLRDDGWFCPELKTMGFELTGAEAMTVSGHPTLQLKLHDGEHALTIYEQRGTSAEAIPLNAATGNQVTEDGFEEIGGTRRSVWVHPGRAWQLVINSGSVTYTVVSTLPVADMPRTISQLMLTEQSQLAYSRPDTPEDPMSRIMRGLAKLAQPSP